MEIVSGRLVASPGDRYALVVSRFNELVTERLLAGAVETLRRHGVPDSQMVVVHVPGSFEIPLAARKLALSGRFAAVICLGAVIQGETSHHEYINQQVASGIQQLAREAGLPITFGILTCPSLEHALERAGGKVGNKGMEAALAALEMVDVLRQLAQLTS